MSRRTEVARPVSIKDVSRAAGVSLGTVSNVLNRPETVSERTRSKVEDAIKNLGYVPNHSARQLRAGRSLILAYIMLDAGNPFFSDVAKGMELVALRNGLALFLCDSNLEPERQRTYLDLLEQQRVLGILLTPVDPDSTAAMGVLSRGTPVVMVDRFDESTSCCSVGVDDAAGGDLAVSHLLDLGHERIAFVGGPMGLAQVAHRWAGGVQAMAHEGRGPDDLMHIDVPQMNVEAGREAARRLAGIRRRERPTAVFCANDLIALGVLQESIALGLQVPGDLAIVGYDDIQYAGAAAIPLTSVRQPRLELGSRAAELAIDEHENPDHVHQRVVFTPDLIVRASTAAPALTG